MRKYVDCIRVTDVNLAYTIIEALEKDDNYSVDVYDQNNALTRKGDGHQEIELRVYHNQKVMAAPTIGFSEGQNDGQKSNSK